MSHILLVEDDPEINRLLTDFLTENGYQVTSLFNGLHVQDCLARETIDLILLDIMLPYRNGDRVLADIRRQYTLPIIIISARETTQNKIDLLRLGADDYITKPFDMEEVLARIESSLRRIQFQSAVPKRLQYKNLIFDGEKKYVLPERTGTAPDCEGTGHTGITNEISRQNIFQGQSVSKCLEYGVSERR